MGLALCGFNSSPHPTHDRHRFCRSEKNGIRLYIPERAGTASRILPLKDRQVSQIVYVINGPNLNLLGSREPDVYGHTTLSDIEKIAMETGESRGLSIEFLQSNEEGALVNWIQQAREKAKGLIVNAAGYTHTSVAIMDALLASDIPIIEVHLSNIYKREDFRHHSYVSRAASGVICGFGAHGYSLAIDAMANLLKSD